MDTIKAKELLINEVNLGKFAAEQEGDELSKYFVETEQWRTVWNGECDIILAPKGCGKSAMFSMLHQKENELIERNILLATESPTGADPLFFTLLKGDESTEASFIESWLLYFLVISTDTLYSFYDGEKKSGAETKDLDFVNSKLKDIGVDVKKDSKKGIMATLKSFIKSMRVSAAVSYNSEFNQPAALIKMGFDDLTTQEINQGKVSIDLLFEKIQNILEAEDLEIWITLDRLDVAFSEYPQNEQKALRALIKTYGRLKSNSPRIRIKSFLRSDIWNSITKTENKFVELSHIEEIRIDWDSDRLLNLIVRRLAQSEVLLNRAGISAEKAISDKENQEHFFYSIFPEQVRNGNNQSKTFEWVMKRIRDGNDIFAPRETIQLFEEARKSQLQFISSGASELTDNRPFQKKALKYGFEAVSKMRLEKTIFAEFPDVRSYIDSMRDGSAQLKTNELSSLWETSNSETIEIIDRLIEIGLIEKPTSRSSRNYIVPFLYRPALGLSQKSR